MLLPVTVSLKRPLPCGQTSSLAPGTLSTPPLRVIPRLTSPTPEALTLAQLLRRPILRPSAPIQVQLRQTPQTLPRHKELRPPKTPTFPTPLLRRRAVTPRTTQLPRTIPPTPNTSATTRQDTPATQLKTLSTGLLITGQILASTKTPG